jgi:threonine dehydrogenase-like Zn-dependent dehydrogenase
MSQLRDSPPESSYRFCLKCELNARWQDAIIKVTACAICGSDLHIFDGLIPSMDRGDILGRVRVFLYIEPTRRIH